jgi:hypothetical protein
VWAAAVVERGAGRHRRSIRSLAPPEGTGSRSGGGGGTRSREAATGGEGSRNPNYPYSYLLKTLIWIFVFVFNMDIRWMYSDPIFNIIRIRHYPKYPAKIRHIRHYLYPKNKVPIENI